MLYPVKNTKCNVLYIFTFCSILTKRSSEKCTRHKIYILYQSHVPFRLYISLWITFVFVVCTCHETENKQREKLILLYNMTRQTTLTSLNRKGNATDMKISNSWFMLIFFLNFNIYQAKIMLCY